MNRFLFTSAIFLAAWLLSSVSGSAIPLEGCFCPGGAGTEVWNTTWGGAPTYTCSDLASIGSSFVQQNAESQCPTGVCSLTYTYQACLDPGCATQRYEIHYRYKCYICID